MMLAVESLSPVTKSCLILCDPVDCSTPVFPVLHHLLCFAQAHVHWVEDAIQPLILCCLLLLLPVIFPSIRVFSNELALRIRWLEYWSFILASVLPGLISFRIEWLDLLAVQGTLKSVLQYHTSKASVLWHLVFCMVQLSHVYMSTRKTTALTRWNFVGKVISLLFKMQSRFVTEHIIGVW